MTKSRRRRHAGTKSLTKTLTLTIRSRVMVPDGPAEWCEWELQAQLRLAFARSAVDAIVSGDWTADTETVDAINRLTAGAAQYLRRSDQAREQAA
jgi:hypothetical protein